MKMVAKMAMVAVAAGSLLVACTNSGSSSSSSGGSTSSSTGGGSGTSGTSGMSSGTASGGCGRPSTATRPEESVCNSDNQCQCGLSCIANQCLRSCTTPGMQGTCGTGKQCVETNTAGTNVCVRIVGRDGDCALATCDTGLECEFGSTDDMTGDPTSAACHLPCNTDGTCPGTDKCLDSTPGFVQIEAAADGGIACNPDAGSACGATYECLRLSQGGPRCARPVRACGVAQKPYGFTPAGDGGVLGPTQDVICNLGPAINDMGGMLPGSLFCDDYRTLPTPPEVFCYNGIDDTAPGFGYCIAICRYFANGDGTAARTMDCPANYYCAVDDAVFYNIAQATPTSPNTTCTTDAQCSAFPGASCVQLNAGTVCAYPYGMCRPGTAPASSSSSGGTGSSVGGSSSSGGTGSSTAGTSTAGSSSAPASSAAGSSAGGSSSGGGASS